MARLDFLTNVQRLGACVTVRKGPKWANARPGDELEIGETGHGASDWGMVLAAHRYSALDEIPKALLRLEHDPDCVTVTGLRFAMQDAYGADFEADRDYYVVLVYLVYAHKGNVSTHFPIDRTDEFESRVDALDGRAQEVDIDYGAKGDGPGVLEQHADDVERDEAFFDRAVD